MKYVIKSQPSQKPQLIDYKKHLNSEQYKVVVEGDGPCLVLAGAGSGKTRTLIYRVAYLLEKDIKPQNILLVTFTNKDARNMQDRIEELLKTKPKGLWNGTFHHIGNRTLRLYAKELGYKSTFGIMDEEDSLSLLKVCIKNLKIDTHDKRFPHPKVIRTVISLSVNSMKSLEDIIDKRYPYFLRFTDSIKKIKE
ncbi:MAG: UvrD-helicase domain-containing protein, partial [Candidatus Omnitrophota bacterium]